MAAWRWHILGFFLCLGFVGTGPLQAEVVTDEPGQSAMLPLPLPRAFAKPVPENVRDLKDMQLHVQKLVARVLPLTVGLRIGSSQGSGVLISKDGYILTAAHVSGKADQIAEIILHDGRKIKGKTLGANQALDSGLVKITEPGLWMHADMAQSVEVRPGNWCLCLGHPLGYQEGRPPVARLGRVLEADKTYIRSDCPLVGGDSGGPLFDMNGQVIGIHSRIGKLMSANVHVPVDTYRETWDRLAKGEIWGSNLFDHGYDVYLGLRLDSAGRVTLVTPYSPAEKAGIKVHDVLTSFDGRKVASGTDLDLLLRDRVPDTEVPVQVRRGDTVLNLRVVLKKRTS
jgi:serine protease Do